MKHSRCFSIGQWRRLAVRGGLVLLVGLFCLPLGSLVSFSSTAFGLQVEGQQQEDEPAVMPEGWARFSGEKFAEAADELFRAKLGPTKELQQQVVEHAWQNFLTSESFVRDGNWAAVKRLTSQFINRREMLVTGETDEEKEASKKVLDEQLKKLRILVKDRIKENPELVTGVSFDELKKTVGQLSRGILWRSEKAKLFADWMLANDWEALSLSEQLDLLGRLDIDQVDANKFSARWSGSVQAAAASEYTFEQLRNHESDAALKVWLDGRLVLDSSAKVKDSPREVEAPAETYRSQPVALQAGQSVAIKAELVFDRDTMKQEHSVYGNRRFPMAVLMWESDTVEQQVIPVSTFTPPKKLARELGDKATGLQGEYFSDLEFGESVVTRLDPGLQMVWRSAAVCSKYEDLQSKLISSCLRSITRSSGLVELDSKKQVRVVKDLIPRLGNRVTCAQRIELIEYLTAQPDLLADLNPSAVNNLLSFSYMLPTQCHLELLGKWGELREVAVCQAGKYPSWGGDYYNSRNHSPLGSIGHLFWGAQWDDAQWLCESCLAKKDGSCNQTIAYVLAFAARFQNKEVWYTNQLDEILSDESLTGDARAGWLLARAFAAEIAISEIPRPAYALPYLEEAYLSAESNALKFRVFQEQISRMISLDQGESAKRLVSELGQNFTTADQRESITQMLKKADELTEYYAKKREKVAKRTGPSKAFVSTLKSRLERARERQDAEAVVRYESRLKALESK